MFESVTILPISVMLIGAGFFFMFASLISLISDPFLDKTQLH